VRVLHEEGGAIPHEQKKCGRSLRDFFVSSFGGSPTVSGGWLAQAGSLCVVQPRGRSLYCSVSVSVFFFFTVREQLRRMQAIRPSPADTAARFPPRNPSICNQRGMPLCGNLPAGPCSIWHARSCRKSGCVFLRPIRVGNSTLSRKHCEI
jgi:hypothetical protein